MPYIGSAPAKLLLFGEHAAVYGYPALGIPLSWRAEVSLTRAERTGWNVSPPFLQELNPLLPQFPKIFPELHALSPFQINIQSNIPIGVGFGSSGALCVALARAVFSAVGIEATSLEVWERAHQLEAFFHKNPSGVDTGISTWEQSGYFEKMCERLPKYQQLPPFQTPLIVGALKRLSSTRELVGSLKERLHRSPELKEHIQALGEMAAQAPACLNDPEKFGALANEAQIRLELLSLSTPECSELFKKAAKFGACGGKLSGAGGGGAFYLVCPDEKVVDRVIERLSLPLASFSQIFCET